MLRLHQILRPGHRSSVHGHREFTPHGFASRRFRVLGVGGFGAVHAAVKKDTGALLAIKRMDKKLIKRAWTPAVAGKGLSVTVL